MAGEDGCTPLWIAAQEGNVGVVEALLARPETEVNKARNTGATPLLQAGRRTEPCRMSHCFLGFSTDPLNRT